MTLSTELITLGRYLAGEFDNRAQALAEPAWYVHLHLWQRPVPLFTEDSITLFAEQANIVNLDHPYRPRILRLQDSNTPSGSIHVQYYMFKNLEAIKGAGRNPELLKTLTISDLELLPTCTLTINPQKITTDTWEFATSPTNDAPCSFNYQNQTYQVFLGFTARKNEFHSYDKGIDPQTGKAIWGALMGSYRYIKRQDFAAELPV
ncbi:MAG TPA: chromophore lyase CpcT/CpeT [Oculatellaceae cyanobacterium]|jgi:hypothetical protein